MAWIGARQFKGHWLLATGSQQIRADDKVQEEAATMNKVSSK